MNEDDIPKLEAYTSAAVLARDIASMRDRNKDRMDRSCKEALDAIIARLYEKSNYSSSEIGSRLMELADSQFIEADFNVRKEIKTFGHDVRYWVWSGRQRDTWKRDLDLWTAAFKKEHGIKPMGTGGIVVLLFILFIGLPVGCNFLF